MQCPVGGERFGDRRRFRAARCCAKAGDDGDLVEDQSGIFDEDGIGQFRRGRNVTHGVAERRQAAFVLRVLRLGHGDVDRLTFQVRQGALRQRGADGASDGDAGGMRSRCSRRCGLDGRHRVVLTSGEM